MPQNAADCAIGTLGGDGLTMRNGSFFKRDFAIAGIDMTPTIAPEAYWGAIQLVSYFFVFVAMLITVAVSARG